MMVTVLADVVRAEGTFFHAMAPESSFDLLVSFGRKKTSYSTRVLASVLR